MARSLVAESTIRCSVRSDTPSSDIESQSTSSISTSTTWSSATLSRMSSWISSQLHASKNVSCELNELPEREPSGGEASETTELQYLLVCVERTNGSIRLMQIDVTGLQSDRILFNLIRQKCLKMRGKWLPLLSLRCLQSINFVQFQLWPSGEVEVEQHFDYKMLPYGANAEEYSYQTPETFPPIGPAKLVHLWNTPNHPDGNGQTCLSMFPKKKRQRVYVGPTGELPRGWGIHLVEGANWMLISVLIISVALISSVVFGISFAVLHHDIQNSFAIASFVITFAGLLIAVCSICSRRTTSGSSSWGG